ncbi:MAG: hypothetical protein AB1455_13360, partial [Pseudomonadota bacterium]
DFRLVRGDEDVIQRAMRDKSAGPVADVGGTEGAKSGRRKRSGAPPASSAVQDLKGAVRKAAARKDGRSKGGAAPRSRKSRR